MPQAKQSPWVTVAEAAEILDVSEQTVRNWCRQRLLECEVKSPRKWFVDRTSVERYHADHPRPGRSAEAFPSPPESSDTLASLREELLRLSKAVHDLRDRSGDSSELEAIEWQRDHYRADAAAVRAAAISINTAAQELRAVLVSLLAVLDTQSEALSQLLAPASPQDLVSG
jgi:hypothetical protein